MSITRKKILELAEKKGIKEEVLKDIEGMNEEDLRVYLNNVMKPRM